MTVHTHYTHDGDPYIHDHVVHGGRHTHDPVLETYAEALERRVSTLEAKHDTLKKAVLSMLYSAQLDEVVRLLRQDVER